MKFETLKDNKKILLVTVIVFIVILTLIISTSLAKYKVTESINIASGKVNYSPSDLNLMGIYLEGDNGYEATNTIPDSGYALNREESYCKIGDAIQDVTISYDPSTRTLTIMPMTQKGLKCYLYFDEIFTFEDIIATKTISTRTDFSTTLTSNTTGTIYNAKDDDGTSYYYAGSPTDNWVKFAGYYWRIIRFNGDGSIRLIYNGTTTSTTGTGTQTSTSAFNSTYSDNMYVGYMYTSGSVHGLGTSSTIKGVLDSWYTKNLSSYTRYIDTNAGFCGDRTPYLRSGTFGNYSFSAGGGTGTTETYYGSGAMIGGLSLKCSNSSDLYTTSSSTKGNKALTYPIGLITSPEVVYAGSYYMQPNRNFYLYTGQAYWTMTPNSYEKNGLSYYSAYVMGVIEEGFCGEYSVNEINGVRPVINLKSNTMFKKGTLGTADLPYAVVET